MNVKADGCLVNQLTARNFVLTATYRSGLSFFVERYEQQRVLLLLNGSAHEEQDMTTKSSWVPSSKDADGVGNFCYRSFIRQRFKNIFETPHFCIL